MNKKIYLFGFIVLIQAIFSFGTKNADRTSEIQLQEARRHPGNVSTEAKVGETEKIEEANLTSASAEFAASASSISNAEIKRLEESFPDKDKVNQDLEANPHTPSKTLMAFAQSLGPLMEKAFKNEGDANVLINQLSECARNESVAASARAMCVTNTERLAQKHNKIQKFAKELRSDVSPEVQKILNTNDAFVKKI